MAAALAIQGLRKSYRRLGRPPRVALDGFDMVVEEGQVHGFLGPNGSGKTTTLRILLGLVRPGRGRMRLLGVEVPDKLPSVARHVGAIVESPRFFPHFTGADTLSLLTDAAGLPRRRVTEVLDTVGLLDRARDRVQTYSLGMRQRLAVAAALLKDPRLLILDEPANGLDPAGIREMRDLLRGLADAGTTVVVSSHILDEVQRTCDTVTIISAGRRVAAGPVVRVLGQHASGVVRVRLESNEEIPRAAEVLNRAGLRVSPSWDHILLSGIDRPSIVSRILAEQGIYASAIVPDSADLESVFLELTTGASRRRVLT